MIQFQQSEQTAARRRWILVLVDSADGVTGLTGQTGTVFISKNGAAAVASTNSIVEVDSGDMPGHYYIELTAVELSDLGWISITKKTAGSLAFHDRAIVSYNDPYTSAGGFSGGGVGESFKLTKKHIDAIAERVWKYLLTEEKTAQDVLLEAAVPALPTDLSGLESSIKSIVIPETDLTPVLEGISRIVIPKLDLEPVLKKIDAIKIPDAINYSTQLSEITKQINEAVAKLDKPDVTTPAIANVLNEITAIQENFDNKITAVLEKDNGATETQKLIEEQQAELVRKLKLVFEQLVEVKFQSQKLAEEIINSKHDILEELTESNG